MMTTLIEERESSEPGERDRHADESAIGCRQTPPAEERWEDGLQFVGLWAGAVLAFF